VTCFRACCIVLWLLIGASQAHAEWISRVTEGIMGTRVTVEVWATHAQQGNVAIDAVLTEMRRIDAAMSTYKPSSEVSQVNAQAGRQPVKISAELFNLINQSLEFSRLTQGAFDITYASVGFKYDFINHMGPDQATVNALLPAINYRHLKLDAKQQTIAFSYPAVRIDLGGIAKGYAVDRALLILKQQGITQAFISAGGDSYVLGDRQGQLWMVGIRDPDDASKVIAKLPLSNVAFSTSGDYERYFDEGGTRIHHIINPSSGRPASNVRSATIIADSATRTDGLSKTAFVLGAEAALKLYSQLSGVEAILVTPQGKVLYSQGLATRIQSVRQ